MANQIQKYVKFTLEELEQSIKCSNSCVKKVNTTLKIRMLPVGLRDFKNSLLNLLTTDKIGSYDRKLQSIILDIRDIKVLGNTFPIRYDDPMILVDIRCDCYVFQPVIGAIICGTVRYVSSAQIGVIIYRVFNASIRLVKKSRRPIEVDTDIYLKVMKYDLESVVPYIEGELVDQPAGMGKPTIKEEAGGSGEYVQSITEIKKEELD